MIRRALEAGVERMYLPNIDSTSIPGLFKLADEYPGVCFPMMGLHPCSVGIRYADELKVVEHWLKKRKFSAIGEIGVDLYWDKSFLDQQLDAFRHQIRLAVKHQLPIVIHTRSSFEEAYNVVKEEKQSTGGKLTGIFHCFSGTAEQAERVIALGEFKLGIGGVLTFKNSGLDKVLKDIDLKYIVLETDAPYLAPVPYRGKRNEPSFLPEVVKKIAELKNCSAASVAQQTTMNAHEVFGN